MNRSPIPPDDFDESDAVWQLLDQASSASPKPSFPDDVVRMARLMPEYTPWWKRLWTPGPAVAISALASAVVVGITLFHQPSQTVSSPVPTIAQAVTPSDDFAEIQDLAETETLIAAADHLDDFSDQELASLIGF